MINSNTEAFEVTEFGIDSQNNWGFLENRVIFNKGLLDYMKEKFLESSQTV